MMLFQRVSSIGDIRSAIGNAWRRAEQPVGRDDRQVRAVPYVRAQSAPTADRSLQKPPVILLGGEANALSVARGLSRMGVKVYAIGGTDTCVRWSRCCEWITVPSVGSEAESWAAYLLSPKAAHLRGSVVLSCSDSGLEVLIHNREALLKHYLLDISDTKAQLAMLDKLTTYQIAARAGVPTPKFWQVSTAQDIVALKDELVFPLLIKPRLSHVFDRMFGKKFLVANNFNEVLTAFETAQGAGIDALLMEMIPGPDTRLSSYFTYLNADGTPLFDFTKRVIRRHAPGMGGACYHIVDAVPQIRDLSHKLFRAAGLRGMANVEFKYDHRDGQYKLIECNARFVASDSLLRRSGLNLGVFVYKRIVGIPQRTPSEFRNGGRLWDPIRDFASFRELHRRGELTWRGWIGSIMFAQSFPYFACSDPGPTLSRFLKKVPLFRHRAKHH